MRRIGKWVGMGLLTVIALAMAAAAGLVLQARQTPTGRPVYVALGSSFAAGPGLGPRPAGSPILCSRGIGSYPRQLARRLGLALVDMSCGGAVTRHLRAGGQFWQGPQLRTITGETRLVTITAGGNDVGYVGDLGLLAARHDDGAVGWLVRTLWRGPRPAERRDYRGMREALLATIRAVRTRAPDARIVVTTYPAILPPTGTCARIRLSVGEADLMRGVARRLQAATRAAAVQGGALLIDMQAIGTGHDACSAAPWTNGDTAFRDAPFHPNLAGATATARAIAAALGRSPAAVPAVGQDDAAGHQAGGVGRQK